MYRLFRSVEKTVVRDPARRTSSVNSVAARQPTRAIGACACGGGCPRCAHSRDLHGAALEGLQSVWRPIEDPDRRFAAQRLGHDFRNVRLHTGAAAQRGAERLHARAWTLGRDIVFGPDEYQPGRTGYRGLLLHELVHVLQQRQSGNHLGNPEFAPSGGELETQADAIARAAAGTAGRTPQVSSAPFAIQRATRVEPATPVEQDLAYSIDRGATKVGFVLVKLNGTAINLSDNPAAKGLPVADQTMEGVAARSLKNAAFSHTKKRSGWTARVTAIPTNVLSTEVHVPTDPPWSTTTTRAEVGALLGLAQCTGPDPCVFSVEGVPNGETLKAETFSHEKLHETDIAAAFESTVGTWDRRLQQAIDTGEGFVAPSALELNAELRSKLGGFTNDVATAFVDEIDRLGIALHIKLTHPEAAMSDPTAAADCSTATVKVAGKK